MQENIGINVYWPNNPEESVTRIVFGSIDNLTVPFLTASARPLASSFTLGLLAILSVNPSRPSTSMEPDLRGDNVHILINGKTVMQQWSTVV